jgi:hypothetical protein
MRICCLATMITTAMLSLSGCGSDSKPPEAAPFEVEGAWIYLGPSDAPHTLTVGRSSMMYTDVGGNWSSNWTITAYDNGLHHFQVAFSSGSGSYLPVGESMSGTYELSGTVLTVQLAKGLTSYPQLQSAGTCTSATDGAPVADCRLYIKK